MVPDQRATWIWGEFCESNRPLVKQLNSANATRLPPSLSLSARVVPVGSRPGPESGLDVAKDETQERIRRLKRKGGQI